MDVLDKYKETWKNQPMETNTFSKVDIYKMSHKKSSSIVKWIFIIGLIEFAVLFSLHFIPMPKKEENTLFDKVLVENILITLSMLSYSVSIYFLVMFYKNYKAISTADNLKTLMTKILATRKTVENYIKINLISLFIVFALLLIYSVYRSYVENNMVALIPIILLSLFIVTFSYYFIQFYYHILYGRLLDKLNANYKELAKLEELNID